MMRKAALQRVEQNARRAKKLTEKTCVIVYGDFELTEPMTHYDARMKLMELQHLFLGIRLKRHWASA